MDTRYLNGVTYGMVLPQVRICASLAKRTFYIHHLTSISMKTMGFHYETSFNFNNFFFLFFFFFWYRKRNFIRREENVQKRIRTSSHRYKRECTEENCFNLNNFKQAFKLA